MTQLTLFPYDGELRIFDVDLGRALGMRRPRDIRENIIRPNLAELLAYGRVCRHLEARRGGAITFSTPCYLNEQQAILVCTLSRSPKAPSARQEITRVYDAQRRAKIEAPAIDYPVLEITALIANCLQQLRGRTCWPRERAVSEALRHKQGRLVRGRRRQRRLRSG